MSRSSEKLNKAVVELVANAQKQKPLELPAAPDLPASVIEQAKAVPAQVR